MLTENKALLAGNLEGFNLLKLFRDYTPEYFCCIFILNIVIILLLDRIIVKFLDIKKSFNEINYINITNSNNLCYLPFSSYLTGLVEGSGYIFVPETEISYKDILNYPYIQILFHIKDLPLALLVQNILNEGSIEKNSNVYVLTINNFKGLQLIINMLNGNMRTPKINSLCKLIN
jgi:hypothetical protein